MGNEREGREGGREYKGMFEKEGRKESKKEGVGGRNDRENK